MRSRSTHDRLSHGGGTAAWPLILFGALLTLSPFPGTLHVLGAQTAGAESSTVRTPSRVRAAELDGEVLVTWRDATGYEGTYQVWRSSSEFEAGVFEESPELFLAGTVSSGVESLIDRPATPGTYHYAVTNDLETPYLIEQRNFLPRPVRVTMTAEQAQEPVTVRQLSVEVQNGSAILRFEPSRHGRRLAVYAATTALTNVEDLQRAVRLGVFDSDQLEYRDYPVPGVPTYYAVLDAEQVISGVSELVPRQNATEQPVRVALGSVRPETGAPQVGARREAPIPLLRMPWLPASQGYALNLNQAPAELDAETQQALASILAEHGSPQRVPPEPMVLPGDRDASDSGLRSSLTTVLAGPFARSEWAVAESQLSNLLTIVSTPTQRARVQFYRGQCLFFLGRYNEASLAFVDARGHLFTESQPWLDAALRTGGATRQRVD